MRSLIFISLLLTTTYVTAENITAKTNTPPPVSIVFAGPVLEGTGVKFKFSIVTTNPLSNTVAIGDAIAKQPIFFEKNAEFKPTQLKNLKGELVSVFQWTGYTEPMEVTETTPKWLHLDEDTHTELLAVITTEDGKVIGKTTQKATYSYAAKQQILMAWNFNKK